MLSPEVISAATLSKHGLVAFFGALVHAARAQRLGESRDFVDFAILTLMSSFSGMMFAFLALHLFGEEQLYITLAMTGTGGYLGVEGMTMIIMKLRQLIGLPQNNENL